MVKIYLRKIRAGEMNLEDVPALWRDKVAKALSSDTE